VKLRIGSGFDAHRLAEGLPLHLGCIEIPFEKGLAGHSDGDCLAHATCDAVLGAAAAGDMGVHFPSSDERWRGVAGHTFLEEVGRIIRSLGYEIENVDATVIAQVPTLAPYLDAMRSALARALSVPVEDISVKAKSTDRLGALGRGEGIAAFVTALLKKDS
jgi:2-C-methyl-D-erythritol 2,4-cyclodiphosphate synthase